MKILFDHQLFYQVYGGASKYFVMMINSLPKDSWDTTTLLSCNEYVRANGIFRATKKIFRGQARILERINKPYTNFILRKQNFDVFHQTDFGIYFKNSLGEKPLVVTYHDANMSTYNPHPEYVKLQKESLERANAIIAVSQNTKKDLLNFFDIEEKKVHVIYHGIETTNIKYESRKSIMDNPYILYVGFRAEYKNFRNFIKAYSLYKEKYPYVKVICTSYRFSPDEEKLFSELGIVDNIVNISANENIMNQLYRNALFFIYPSLYEGFGMPILEAWINKCPVVLSNTSSFPEVAGDAGLYFNPLDLDDMLDKMIKITENNEIRQAIIIKGSERVRNFSWEKCAKRHLDVYESII